MVGLVKIPNGPKPCCPDRLDVPRSIGVRLVGIVDDEALLRCQARRHETAFAVSPPQQVHADPDRGLAKPLAVKGRFAPRQTCR
jgi:hypothetical protein